jgi:glycosyltransferase involved in cell wall biosynthesis
VGGAEKFFINLVNGIHHSGIVPLVIVLDDDNSLLKDLNKQIEYILLPRKYKYDFSISLKIKNIIKAHGIKKVFCVEGFSFFMSKILFLRNNNVVFYLSLHSTLPISQKRYYLDLFYLKFFLKTDKVVFICEYQRRLFKTKYYFNPRHSTVIYNGINLNYFSREQVALDKSKLNWRNLYQIPEHDKVILLVGRISIEKGHIDSLKALKLFHQKYNKTAHLVFVGDGNQDILDKIKKTISDLDLFKYVHLTGATKDVRPYLYTSDIFTLTSFSETFSMAALEALSMELPCSLTNVGGAAEMLAEGRLGVLSEPKDPDSIASSWRELLENLPQPNTIRNYVENHYSLEKMVSNYQNYLSA